MWNLSSYASNPSLRLPYEDIPNTADFKAFNGDFAFGGLYDLQVLDHVAYSHAKKATHFTREEIKAEEKEVEEEEKENFMPFSPFNSSFNSSVVTEKNRLKDDNVHPVEAAAGKNSGTIFGIKVL